MPMMSELSATFSVPPRLGVPDAAPAAVVAFGATPAALVAFGAAPPAAPVGEVPAGAGAPQAASRPVSARPPPAPISRRRNARRAYPCTDGKSTERASG